MPEIPVNLTHAKQLTPEVVAAVRDVFEYHAWDEEQQRCGMLVRNVLAEAYQMLIQEVPPCPTRTRALNLLTDCRMLANSALTHRGRY